MKPLSRSFMSHGKHAYVFSHRAMYTKLINMPAIHMRGGIRL